MSSPEPLDKRPITRRQLLAGSISLAAGSVLAAACAAPAAPSPTTAPAQSAAAPTTAPAPTTVAPAATTAAPTAAPAAAAASPTAASAQPTAAPSATAQPAAQPAAKGASAAPVVPLYKISTGSKPFFDEANNRFKQLHPDIPIEPVYVNEDEYDTKADLMVAAGNPPSLFYPAANRCYRYYASKSLILNLEPMVARDKYSLDDFPARQLAGCKFKGVLQAIPKSHSSWVLFYHKGAFDKAKLEYPPTDWKDPNWTWDKYLEYAKTLTLTSGGKVQQYGSGSDFGTGWTSGWSHGGEFFNKDWPDTGWITKYTAPDDQSTIDAVQFWADLPNKYHYSPTNAEQQATQAGAPNLFMTGRIAMYLEYTGQLSQIAKITEFDWGIAAWPHATGSQYPMHHGAWIDQWAIFKDAKNLDGSWEFLKFMASPEGETITDIRRGSPSSRQSVGQARVDLWKGQLPKIDAKQLQVVIDATAIDNLTPDNWSVNFSPIDDKVLEPALQKVDLGQQTAADALKGLKAQMDPAIASSLKTMGYSG